VGYIALSGNTSGTLNTAVGVNALTSNQTGNQNVAVGYNALYSSTVDGYNTAVGAQALQLSVSGINNVAVGFQSLANNTVSNNTAVGFGSLSANTSGAANTVMGSGAGDNVTTGSDNTFVGNEAGDTVTTGQQITIVGGYSDASATIQNATAIGYNTNVTATNNIFLGNTSVSAIKGQVSFSTYSDERIKKDIKDTDLGLEFIKELKPRKYKRVAPKDYPEEFKDPNKDDLNNPDYIVDGLVAQEVKQTMDKLDVTFSGWDKDENTTKQSLEYPAFVPALIKAIQELSTQVDELKSELLALKGE
jgi:trimeric autotransporter adhesin